jgi:hypothetical protein
MQDHPMDVVFLKKFQLAKIALENELQNTNIITQDEKIVLEAKILFQPDKIEN